MATLTVYAFKPDAVGDAFVADISPFPQKVMAHLLLSGTEFTISGMEDKGRPKPPKGKIPYAKFSDGKVLGDSQMIIEEVENRSQTSLDDKLSAEQRAVSHLVRRTLEESIYWNGLIEKRWRRKNNFVTVTAPRYFAGLFPVCLKPCFGFISGHVRKQVVKTYEGQGMGRHSEVEAAKLAMDDLRAIESMTSNGPFFHGQEKSSIDAVLYAFVGGLLYQKAAFPAEGVEKDLDFQQLPKLLAHFKHMDGLLRPDLMKVTKFESQ